MEHNKQIKMSGLRRLLNASMNSEDGMPSQKNGEIAESNDKGATDDCEDYWPIRYIIFVRLLD